MSNPKLQYLAEAKRTFYDRKSEYYRRHAERPFIESVYGAMRGKQPVPIEDSKKALLLGNERVVSVVGDFTREFGPLVHGGAGEYELAVKQCVDARTALFNLMTLLTFSTIHERTAGAVVRHGGVFKVLKSPAGRGYIATHTECGGEGTAHVYHVKGEKFNDPQIDHIIDSIPHGIATIGEESQEKNRTEPPQKTKEELRDLRSRWNARSQEVNASAILESVDNDCEVHPLFENWRGWREGRFELEWLSRTQTTPDGFYKEFRRVNQMTWQYSMANGITPEHQYSHAVIYYDPYRLGRVNGPRQIFDSSPNEIFCVTEDFRAASNGHSLSLSAIGSLRYAAFLDGGHVYGVGKNGGNRHIVILDTDLNTLRAVREKLLRSSADIAELSGHGGTITLALYDRDTAKVEFIQ
ncbi:MAG: hypothetical protein AB1529_00550 [Candidatus Micrarchaeota archaeon]